MMLIIIMLYYRIAAGARMLLGGMDLLGTQVQL
jgi:hypothetical protein